MKTLLNKTFIILFFGVYFIPEAFSSIDRIGPQFLVLSVLNIIGFSYLFFNYDDYVKPFIKSLKKEYIYLISYFSFLFFSFLSIIYVINLPEFVITFSQYFTVFITFILTLLFLYRIKEKFDFFINLFVLLTFFEVLYMLVEFIPLYDFDKGILRNRFYSGAAANINIASFSLAYKSPVIIYKILTVKRSFSLFVFSLILSMLVFCIFITYTRGAFLALSFSFFSMLIYFIYKNFNKMKRVYIKNIAFSILTIGFTFMVFKFLNQNNLNTKLTERYASISLDTKDGSVNQRLRYYKQILERASKNPFVGVGLGNHKLISINDDKFDISQYIIPYHAHNDFLQILSESGILALLSYILFLFFLFRYIFLLWYKSPDKDQKFLFFTLFVILMIYMIDASLNFPIARPINQVQFVFLASIIISSYLGIINYEKR